MVEVAPLPTDMLMLLSALPDGLCTALAALLAARDALLRLLQLVLCRTVVARVFDELPVGGDKKDLQAHVDAGLASSELKRLRRDFSTGAADIPAIRLFGDGDGLDRTLHRA